MELIYDPSPANSSFVEMFWYVHNEQAGAFTSVAITNWDLMVTRYEGKTVITAHGPETRATEADFPADAEYFGITFKLGTFMPHLPIKTIIDRQDAILPEASNNSFWLYCATWEVPTIENADVFVNRLIRQGILVHDPVIAAAIDGQIPDLSPRSLQYRFLQATGLSQKTIQQIRRARSAASLLEQGTPILDTAFELGYFDQAHLTNSLKRFVGKTPAQIVHAPQSAFELGVASSAE